MDYDLWLEFEHVQGVDDFANIGVTFTDGRRYRLNVWTFAFFETARSEGEFRAAPELQQTYMFPPDLFVTELTRPVIEAVVADLVASGGLPAHRQLTNDEL